ncbi:MAG: ABC transporter ATP-binding protein [Deltaproteobacteria bacterium]|nr:ABC transporter ATP-binding protein [Deltaproteobacteria bacterium]
MVLKVNNIVTLYGQSLILDGVSLDVDKGEVVALLGRNGAGKTTTMRSVMGLTPPRSGSIKLLGIEIVSKLPFQIAALGIGYAPDDRRIFPDLTTEENLLLAGRLSKRTNGDWSVKKVYNLFPTLKDLRHRKGGFLSGGEQKMLALGRALMTNPALVLIDEPSEGLAPLMVAALAKAIREIRDTGVTVFLADQNVRFCRKTADRGYIIEKGTIRYEDEMKNILENEEIVKKYLTV